MELVFQVVQVPCDSVSQSSINFVSLSVCVCVLLLSCVQFFATLWTVAHQGSLSMDFSREEYWSGLPFPTPGDLPDPGIQTMTLVSSALAGGFFTAVPPGKLLLKGYKVSVIQDE